MDGILNIDKPYGITSMDIVRRIKRGSGQKRVGHGGTLDPVATGVVPICLGQATRLMEYLVNSTKDYRATVELGASTDTYDAFGSVTGGRDASYVELTAVQEVLKSFQGIFKQVPPMYSALKRNGKRLYELARAGIEVEREPRRVEVFRIEIVDWSPPRLTLEVSCGRGFYMRSLAHDLGDKLGCGGHIRSLVRLRSGAFELSDSISLSEMEDRFEDGSWRLELHSPDVVLQNLRAVLIGRQKEEMIRNGRPIHVTPQTAPVANEQCRAYSVDGRFLAVLSFDESAAHWQPHKVFSFAEAHSSS